MLYLSLEFDFFFIVFRRWKCKFASWRSANAHLNKRNTNGRAQMASLSMNWNDVALKQTAKSKYKTAPNVFHVLVIFISHKFLFFFFFWQIGILHAIMNFDLFSEYIYVVPYRYQPISFLLFVLRATLKTEILKSSFRIEMIIECKKHKYSLKVSKNSCDFLTFVFFLSL